MHDLFHSHGEEPAILVLALLFVAGFFALQLFIHLFVCWWLHRAYDPIPRELRQMEPGLVWLLLIPCFSLVWNFFVFPRLSRSYQAHFAARGDTTQGDCGEQIGLWYSICAATTWIPCIGSAVGLASLVLLVIYLIRIGELRTRALSAGGAS